jgi:hypothetical protein
MAQYITDPELLAELEGKKKKPASSQKYVTDPKLLAELNKAPEPESALQTLGRSSASLADTLVNTATGLADIPARAAIRAYQGTVGGKSLPEAERIAQQYGTSPKDTFGRAFNVTGTPGYENAPLRSLGTMAGQAIGENVINPIAQATGLPEGYIGDVASIGAAGVAPGIPKVAGSAVRGAQKVAPLVKAPIDIGRGFYQGVKGIEPGSAKSAVVPLSESYYPTPQVQQFMRGEIDLPTLQASQKPSASLFATPDQQSALRMAERMPGDPNVPLIPVQGKGMQAFGERVGREYVTDPYRAAADVGLSVVAGMPLPLSAAQRALQARQSRTLSQAANFDPAFRQRLAQAETQPIPSAPGPIAPATSTALTVQGPGQQLPPSVIPMSGPQRNVNIEGQRYTLPNQIDVSNSQAARPQMQGPTPQQMAIQKTQEIVAQRQQPQKAAGPVAPTQLPPAVQPQPKPPAPQTAPATATNPKPTTEVKNYGSVGLREIKEIEARAKETGEPIKYTYFRKGEGNTTVTLNKEIKFKPDPDLKLTSAKELNNGNKEFYGVQTSTGSPVTVKFTKGKDIAVYDTNGKAIIKYDMTGKVIKD